MRFQSILKIGSFVAASSLIGAAGSALAEEGSYKFKPTHARTSLNWSLPRSDDNWDGGLGFQGQLLMPAEGLPKEYRYGLSLGVSDWDANEDTQTITGGNAASGALSGDAQIVQLGVSLLREHALPQGINLTLETGLVYQNFTSDTNLTFNYASSATSTQKLELDDIYSVLLAADINFTASEDLDFYAGLAYQFDLTGGNAAGFSDTNENVANALVVRSGIEIKF